MIYRAMVRNKPFSKTEMKILAYNRMKRGYSYDEAVKHVQKEVEVLVKNGKATKEKKDKENKASKTFKEEFSKLTAKKNE